MRPTKDEWALRLAIITSQRATCARRQVGCVLLDVRGHVLATGYNGPYAGAAHCIEVPCAGAKAPSGTRLELCEAIHAEQNALLQCRDVHAIDTCYVTTSPCVTCVKLLLNTSCRRIVFVEPYAHDAEARKLWTKTTPDSGYAFERGGRAWEQRCP